MDQALQDAGSYEEFLEIFPAWDMRCGEKSAFQCGSPERGRARRLDRLGEDYTEESLQQRFGRLPIPEMTGEEIPAEWTYVFIPYRERHLTRYQKERFLRRYRQGKPIADSKTWKYRAAIQELKKLQEEFDFLAAYRIQDKAQLKAISDAAKEQLWENSRARKQLQKEILPYEEMLLLFNKLQENRWKQRFWKQITGVPKKPLIRQRMTVPSLQRPCIETGIGRCGEESVFTVNAAAQYRNPGKAGICAPLGTLR